MKRERLCRYVLSVLLYALYVFTGFYVLPHFLTLLQKNANVFQFTIPYTCVILVVCSVIALCRSHVNIGLSRVGGMAVNAFFFLVSMISLLFCIWNYAPAIQAYLMCIIGSECLVDLILKTTEKGSFFREEDFRGES